MARRRGGERVLGPYHDADRRRWRVIVVDDGGKPNRLHYPTEEEARQVVKSLRRELNQVEERTVGQALDAYELYLREKGNKPNSVDVTMIRLRSFFASAPGVALHRLDQPRCEQIYLDYRTRPTRFGRPPSVDTHRNLLAEAKTFLKWCCTKQRWLARNPMAPVEGVGARSEGKEQLGVTESRLWLDKAIELADNGERGAVAAMMTLLLGLRASEVVLRVVRDVDDEGRTLWIRRGKTKRSRRKLEVPEILRPYLVALSTGRVATDSLLGFRDRGTPRKWVKRICKATSVPVVTAHGMRGTHSSLAEEHGETSHAVAAELGHTSIRVTEGAYVDPSTLATARVRRLVGVLRPKKPGNDSPRILPQEGGGNTKPPPTS